MPNRTPPRPAPKAATGKPAAKKAAARPAAKSRRPPAPAPAADAAALRELAARLSKLELSGLAEKLVQGWRADLTAIIEASRKSYAGLQAIVGRQTSQIKEAAAELQSVGKLMTVVGAAESARNLDNLARAGLELALADIRELATLAANSQREAFEILQTRVTNNIDEVQQLLRK